MIAPQVLSVIQRRFAGPARRRALGWYAATISLGAVTGQVLGGLLTSADILGLSWRTVFLVNVPVGLLLLTLGPAVVPRTRSTTPRPIDRRGTVLIAATVAALLVPLVLGRGQGWPVWVWPVLAVGLALAGATLAHLRVTPPGRAVLDLAILRQWTVAAGFGSLLATMAAYGGLLFCLALLLQDGLGFTPLESGLALVPYILGFATVSLLAARVSGRALRIGVLGGLAVVGAG